MPPLKHLLRGRRMGYSDQGLPSNDAIPELPDELIQYVSPTCEPPRKRQKMAQGANFDKPGRVESQGANGETPDGLDYIVVNESTWEVKCNSSKLSDIELPMERANINLHAPFMSRYILIQNDEHDVIFTAQLPGDDEGLEDVRLALDVHDASNKSHLWSKYQGRMWTEFDVILLQHDGIDHVKIVSTIKWNLTHLPQGIPLASKKPLFLQKALEAYFPDQNVTMADTWTPHDFYQSAHTPATADEVAASIDIDIKSELYPFQKRTVRWLLQREGVDWTGTDVRPRDFQDTKDGSLPPTFVKTKDARGQTFFLSSLYGCATRDTRPFHELRLDGGILAEEMGLGKTLEIISLITLHPRPQEASMVFDPYTATNVRPIGATLIVCPPTLVQQWIAEVKKHSDLKIVHYEGTNNNQNGTTSAQQLDQLANSDIVVSTYSVLAAEIHFTGLNPEKSLRRPPKYQRPESPLMKFSWWRICMDEAQMVESWVTKAAVVARIVPRINAWCITGTPVRKSVDDLLGLLVFLRVEPFVTKKHIWGSLISSHKTEFRRLFGHLALRHNKKTVRNELRLPAQKRYVLTMPFTPIEEEHYQELFNQMCHQLNLDLKGAPIDDEWDPELEAENMRRWLIRLRHTCMQPAVGDMRTLRRKDGALSTVDEVLDWISNQNYAAIRTHQRALLASKLERGQAFENSPRVREALTIWDEAAREASEIVGECREIVLQETAKFPMAAIERTTDGTSNSAGTLEDSSLLRSFQAQLRMALEIEHRAVFFRANAYFQIKTNTDMTTLDSPEYQRLEKLEASDYQTAKHLRREILSDPFQKADKLMEEVSERAGTQAFAQIPEFASNPPKGGLESHQIIEQLDILATALDIQANTLDEWREHTIQLLLRPLVDEDEELEVTGDEYEESTKNQDEMFCYMQALRAAIADRHDALIGQENQLIVYEVKTALRLAREDKGPFPQKAIALLTIREELKPTKEMGSIRGIITDLRAVASSLRPSAENGSSRAKAELLIVEKELGKIRKQLSEQTKATVALEKEIDLFTLVMNARLEYYRQLQQVSDSVSPDVEPGKQLPEAKILLKETNLANKIATCKAKQRYLEHLKEQATNPEDLRVCVICRDTIEVGSITICGHQFCSECLLHWWHAHHSCPVCKRRIILAETYQVTYKRQELSIQADGVQAGLVGKNWPSTTHKSAIYSDISKSKLAEIKNIELKGPTYTTKVSTLGRHLIWLRQSDPGAKTVIYSQFKDFLDTLQVAFRDFGIGFSSINKPNGIEKFKNDPGVECFLLHARAHSSGLNLVNASHVFLCEPLLNTALELQAIARVDRIGQQQETTVWLYLTHGTVEESIHQLSVRKRMEHIGQALSRGKGKAKATTPEEILDTSLEEANSLELQEALPAHLMVKNSEAGETVGREDLWECLFGGADREDGNGGGSSLVDEQGDGLSHEVGRTPAVQAMLEGLGELDD